MSDAIADVLDDAADLIEGDGWLQELYRGLGASRAHCPVGAITDVRALSVHKFAARHALDLAVRPSACAEDWNDVPERTKQEVLDLLRKLAKEQRS